ncbi:MAG: deoxyribose-phosphate aldolase [Myxococcales bacterium]|nr:deoxyribose-phosphate aldolase [Myxococcales bacterium]
MPRPDLAPFIEHTLLAGAATAADVERLCDEAVEHGFFGVCVTPARVALCRRRLDGTGVRVVSVVGFPLGANLTTIKAVEAVRAVGDGADELDVVAALGALRDGAYDLVVEDICQVVRGAQGRPVKVILETGALTEEQKRVGAALAKGAGAAFVKTSTGFGPGGATVEDVRLLRSVVGATIGVKASGGVRDAAAADALIEAGATRIGTSRGVAIVQTDAAPPASGPPVAPAAVAPHEPKGEPTR